MQVFRGLDPFAAILPRTAQPQGSEGLLREEQESFSGVAADGEASTCGNGSNAAANFASAGLSGGEGAAGPGASTAVSEVDLTSAAGGDIGSIGLSSELTVSLGFSTGSGVGSSSERGLRVVESGGKGASSVGSAAIGSDFSLTTGAGAVGRDGDSIFAAGVGGWSRTWGTRHFDFFEAPRPRPKRSGKLADSLGIRDII